MGCATRNRSVGSKPLGSYIDLTSRSSPGVSAGNAARVYYNGTNLMLSLGGGAEAAIETTSGGPITVTGAFPLLTLNGGAANTSGTMALFQWNAATTIAAVTNGLKIDLQTNVTPGANVMSGILIMPANNTQSFGIQFGAGGGAQVHFKGPSDQNTKINSGTAQGILVALDFVNGNVLRFNDLTNGDVRYNLTNTALGLRSSTVVGWSSTTDASVAADTGLARNAAGVVEVNNGTAGSFANLIVGTAITASDSSSGLKYSRTVVPAGGSSFTGIGVNIQNTATATNSYTEGSTGLLTINHAPVAGAGTVTDTTVLAALTATPVSSAAVKGLFVTMGANATSYALQLKHGGTAAGANSVALSVSGGNNNSQGIEMADGRNVAVSNLNQGRLIYNSSTQTFQTSVNGGAFANIGGGSSTLASAYTGGASITVTAANPVLIQNAAAVTSDLLDLDELNNATNGDYGITYDRTATPTAATTFTGGFVNVQNTPTATNSFTETSVLVNINHAPVAGAGTITDTAIGLKIAMTPLSTGVGNGFSAIQVIMGANTPATGKVLDVTWNGTAGSTGYIRLLPAGTQTGATVGFNFDATNAANVAQSFVGMQITTNASTAGDGAAQAAIVVDSRMTGQRIMDLQARNTSAVTGLIVLRYGASTTLTASAFNGVLIDLNTSVVAATNNPAVTGITLTMPQTSAGTGVHSAITINPANNTTSFGVLFGTGGGAQVHFKGPSDQPFAFKAGTNQKLTLAISAGTMLDTSTDGSVFALGISGTTTAVKVATANATGNPLNIGGNLSWGQSTQTASSGGNYNFVDTDATIFVDMSALTGGQNYNVTLLTPVGRGGRIVCVKISKLGNATSTLTIKSAAGNIENIAGGTGIVLTQGTSFFSRLIQSDGTNWWLISTDL